jgi:AbiV family abortive infection protein
MRPRAIADLQQLSDDRFFAELTTGMRLCFANALRLWRDAAGLGRRRRPQASHILALLAAEEATKVIILFDAARCPRQPQQRLTRHLKTFNSHLARGLYAMCHDWALQDVGELRRHIDRERQTLYLDGPGDVDWIFRNDIERRREEVMYVDYVARQDYGCDEHFWNAPNPDLLRIYFPPAKPGVLRILHALHRAGVLAVDALRAIAEYWRPITITDTMTWGDVAERNSQMLHRLQAAGIRGTQPAADLLIRSLQAPLYEFDLTHLDIDAGRLRDAQANWTPDDY